MFSLFGLKFFKLSSWRCCDMVLSVDMSIQVSAYHIDICLLLKQNTYPFFKNCSLVLTSWRFIQEEWIWCAGLIWRRLLRRWMAHLVQNWRYSLSPHVSSPWTFPNLLSIQSCNSVARSWDIFSVQNCNLCAYSLLVLAGRVHRSRNVCFEREKGSCNTGRFRDGGGQGNEEGDREKHVTSQAVEVGFRYAYFVLFKGINSEDEIYRRFYFSFICQVCEPSSDCVDTQDFHAC